MTVGWEFVRLAAGGSWIRTFSSALDRQRFRGFVRVGSIYRRPGHPSTCRPRHTIELSRDGPRGRHSPRIRQRRRCKRIAEPNPRRSWEAVTPSRLDQQHAVLRGTESLLTLCWRGVDSNFRFREGQPRKTVVFFRAAAVRRIGGARRAGKGGVSCPIADGDG